MDVSLELFGLHIGVQRSPIRNIEQFKNFVDLLDDYKDSIQLVGVMVGFSQIVLFNPSKFLIFF